MLIVDTGFHHFLILSINFKIQRIQHRSVVEHNCNQISLIDEVCFPEKRKAKDCSNGIILLIPFMYYVEGM